MLHKIYEPKNEFADKECRKYGFHPLVILTIGVAIGMILRSMLC